MTPEWRNSVADIHDDIAARHRWGTVWAAFPWPTPWAWLCVAAALKCWANTGDWQQAAWWAGTVGLWLYGFGFAIGIAASVVGVFVGAVAKQERKAKP